MEDRSCSLQSGRWHGLRLALAWFFFPLVPAFLGTTYHQELVGTLWYSIKDPRDWGWFQWLMLIGPLIGYGFLAGATLDLPDDPARRGWKGWFSRRSLWVAVGPWLGFLVWAGIFHMSFFVGWAYPPSRQWSVPPMPQRWWAPMLFWILFAVCLVGPLAYGWLPIAWAALRRARRLGRLGSSFGQGLAFAAGFVGSLFGSFWAITEVWRSYFFDPRVMPALLAGSTLVVLAGCAAPETLGESRRRELFQAMLLSWLIGLALAWRWWSRSRPKPGPPS